MSTVELVIVLVLIALVGMVAWRVFGGAVTGRVGESRNQIGDGLGRDIGEHAPGNEDPNAPSGSAGSGSGSSSGGTTNSQALRELRAEHGSGSSGSHSGSGSGGSGGGGEDHAGSGAGGSGSGGSGGTPGDGSQLSNAGGANGNANGIRGGMTAARAVRLSVAGLLIVAGIVLGGLGLYAFYLKRKAEKLKKEQEEKDKLMDHRARTKPGE